MNKKWIVFAHLVQHPASREERDLTGAVRIDLIVHAYVQRVLRRRIENDELRVGGVGGDDHSFAPLEAVEFHRQEHLFVLFGLIHARALATCQFAASDDVVLLIQQSPKNLQWM